MGDEIETKLSLTRDTNWMCLVFNLQTVLSFFCGLHFIFYEAYITTTLFSLLLIFLGHLGVTAGAHRLWAHQSYVASSPLKLFLMLCQTLAGQGSIYDWVRDHRLHHKHFGTDLDPYNPSKGFVYSHFIAYNLKYSPAQENALKEIDMSDLENDKIVMFQKKFYYALFLIWGVLLPINAPAEYWGETILNSTFIAGWFRYGFLVQLSLLVYSAHRIWDVSDSQGSIYNSYMIFIINKSHWLSYHYLAPWDYQTSEYGKYGNDFTSQFIRVCAALELATDLKTTDSDLVREALSLSVDKDIPIEDTLLELQKTWNKIPKDHYLNPSKFYCL